MAKFGSVHRITHAKRRFRRVKLAAGVAVIAVAATGVAVAGVTKSPAPRDSFAVPKIDGESARAAMLSYLVEQGMSPRKARQRMANQDVALKAAAKLRTRVPSHVGSLWLDDDGKLMVRVLDDAGEREAKALGAKPVLSTLASGDLEKARDTLAEDAQKNPPEGLSSATFGIDESAGKVIARYFFEKSGGAVPKAATELGDLVTATAAVGEIRPSMDVQIAGASMKDVHGNLCTAGWAVDIADPNGGTPKNGVMTAAHCFDGSFPFTPKFDIDTAAGGNTQGTKVLREFGKKGDYGVLELGNGHRGDTKMIDGIHVVEAIQEPVKGAAICKDGAKTQQTCGEISEVDVSMLLKPDDPFGRYRLVENLTRSNYCSEKGDSGAPVFSEFDEGTNVFSIAAVGIHAALNNSRDSQGKLVCESFFTPLSRIDFEGKFRVRIQGG